MRHGLLMRSIMASRRAGSSPDKAGSRNKRINKGDPTSTIAPLICSHRMIKVRIKRLPLIALATIVIISDSIVHL
jgi:hypothetical protein